MSQLGVRVSAIFPQRAPLERVLGDEVGAAIGAIHRANGVELLHDAQLVAFEGDERVDAAVTAGGDRVRCDFVVAGVGIRPQVPAFPGRQVARSDGVLVDELCRAADPDVYAAGDVANHLHPVFGRIRVEHFNNAERQGRAAARSMLGGRLAPGSSASRRGWLRGCSPTSTLTSGRSAAEKLPASQAFENSGMFAPLAGASGLSSSATTSCAASPGFRRDEAPDSGGAASRCPPRPG